METKLEGTYKNLPYTLADQLLNTVSGTVAGDSLRPHRDKLVEEFKRVGADRASDRARQIEFFARSVGGELALIPDFASLLEAIDKAVEDASRRK